MRAFLDYMLFEMSDWVFWPLCALAYAVLIVWLRYLFKDGDVGDDACVKEGRE